MLYSLVAAILFALLYGEAAYARSPQSALAVALVALAASFAALEVPPRLFTYSNQQIAPAVLTRLMQNAALGSAFMLVVPVTAYLAVAKFADPTYIGELYLFALLSIMLFQGFGGVVTRHVMYLQQTNQYNSNQLAAVLLMVTLLLFVLVLYFLSFDLARPPELHPYLRDLLAISITLVGYGRAVYLMAHH